MKPPSKPPAQPRKWPIDSAPARLHPRNRHQGRYDFARLTAQHPALYAFVLTTQGGESSIDFSHPGAVRALNCALLKADYGIAHWDIPDGYLCPPIPGRADYLHGLADLLAGDNGGAIPRGPSVRGLDIGVGANCIYPLLGHSDYGWRFVGSDIDADALAAAEAIVRGNGLAEAIELRRQSARGSIFSGLVRGDERFEFSLCNPPFHASAQDAARGSQRKQRHLARTGRATPERGDQDSAGCDSRTPLPALNFGGQATELWCTGGEASFVRRMIRESAGIPRQVMWFSSLVSNSENLGEIRRQLRKADARDVREVPMAQGHKQSRFVAWTFLDAAQRGRWRLA